MRRRLVQCLSVLLSVLLVSLVIFGSGLVDVSRLSFVNSLDEMRSASSTASVSVDPAAVVHNYYDLPIGSKFTVHVNVTDVTDLFSWQINMTWNSTLLNVSRVIPDEFLARSVNLTSSEILGSVINSTSDGSIAVTEGIMADVPGIAGNGALVSIEFLVTGYGWTELTIGLTGSLATTLLDSSGDAIAFTVANGWFDNRIRGDPNGDGTVDTLDVATISAHWYPGPPVGPLGYSREVDMNYDGSVEIVDVSLVSAYWTGPPKGPLVP